MPVTIEFMDQLRERGDDLADATVDALFEQGQIGHVNTLMRWFDGRDRKLPEDLPAVVRDYLAATATPPDWVDWETMETARMFFIDNNVHISTVLSFAAMPACYVVPHVARLLATTHSLDYPANRMAATGQFTVYLMRPDAFEAGGAFVPTAQKVRLLHAAIRHHLRREDVWDQTRWGVPICQEDMIAGQLAFSIMVLDGLHRLGIHVSQKGAEAYFYAWRVVGAMLGVDVAAAPSTLEAARDFSDMYMTRYMGPSDEGAALTRQLIAMYEQVVPGTLLDPIVPALIRYLLGDTVADWLAVPRSTVFDHLVPTAPRLLGALEDAKAHSPIAAMLLDRLGALTTAFELSSLTRGRVMHYAVPEHLKHEYKVPRLRDQRWTPPPVSTLCEGPVAGRSS